MKLLGVCIISAFLLGNYSVLKLLDLPRPINGAISMVIGTGWGYGGCVAQHRTVTVRYEAREGACHWSDDPWYRYAVVARLAWEYFGI